MPESGAVDLVAADGQSFEIGKIFEVNEPLVRDRIIHDAKRFLRGQSFEVIKPIVSDPRYPERKLLEMTQRGQMLEPVASEFSRHIERKCAELSQGLGPPGRRLLPANPRCPGG